MKAFKGAVQSSGAQLAIAEKINIADEAGITRTVLLKVKKSGADSILWTGTDAGAIALIKTMQEMNFYVPVLGTNDIEKVVSAGKVNKGNLELYSYMGNTSTEFANKFAAVYGAGKRFDYAEGAYDLTMIAAQEAVANASATNAADYIKKNINYTGFGGKYSFDINGDVASSDWRVIKLK